MLLSKPRCFISPHGWNGVTSHHNHTANFYQTKKYLFPFSLSLSVRNLFTKVKILCNGGKGNLLKSPCIPSTKTVPHFQLLLLPLAKEGSSACTAAQWQKFIVFPGTRKGPSWGVSPTPCQCGRKLIDAITISCTPQKSCPVYMPGSIFSRASTCLSMCLSGDYLNHPGNPSMFSNMSWASPTQSLQNSKHFEY